MRQHHNHLFQCFIIELTQRYFSEYTLILMHGFDYKYVTDIVYYILWLPLCFLFNLPTLRRRCPRHCSFAMFICGVLLTYIGLQRTLITFVFFFLSYYSFQVEKKREICAYWGYCVPHDWDSQNEFLFHNLPKINL